MVLSFVSCILYAVSRLGSAIFELVGTLASMTAVLVLVQEIDKSNKVKGPLSTDGGV